MSLPPFRAVLLGVAQLARGRADGFRNFAGTKQALLASLAPLVAFPLVGTVLSLGKGNGVEQVTDFLQLICGLLAPLVVSHDIARRWGHEAPWLAYATAFCWCQWAIPMAAAGLVLVLFPAIWGGLSGETAAVLLLGGLMGYALWLHWFLARRGLGLSAGRAAAFVAVVSLVTGALVTVPALLAGKGLLDS